jgi:hypothetical protein
MSILLDNLDKLTVINQTSSYIRCICPCCSGNLKISLSNHAYGAYRCYDNYCDPKDIREAIGLQDSKNYYLSPYKQEISRSVYTDNQLVKKIESAKPIVALPETELIRCDDYQPLETTTRTFVDGSKKKTSIFPYSAHQRVYRLDFLDENTKKQIYLQYLAEDGSWEVGNGSHTWQLFTHGLDLTQPGNTVLFCEGEATTEFVKTTYGLATITAASPCYSYDYLYKIFFVLKAKNPNIKQVIICPDFDDPGEHKADKVLKVCHYLKIAARKVALDSIVGEAVFQGADLANFNLDKEYLEECLITI